MTSKLTAAAGRILERAMESARRRASPIVEPIDLLKALLSDESRGAALLAEYGISQGDDGTASFLDETLKEDLDRVSLSPLESDAFSAVVDAARREAAQGGRTAEMGSEHLALGLAEVPSVVSVHFEERGATAESIRRALGVVGETFGDPIATDLVLDAEGPGFGRRHILRAIDAAANRAAEGLRVAEDYARFVQNDAYLTRVLKNLRHAVAETIAAIPLAERLAARDTSGDVGTSISSPSAASRVREAELLAANLHRAEEALRSLEEFGRLIEPSLGSAFEKLRYQLYTVEKTLAAATTARDRLAGRDLYVLLTSSRCARSAEEVVRAAAAGGATMFQVREKQMTDRELLSHLKAVRRWTAEVGAFLIVNDRPDLAVLCGADGVHVGQDELTVREARHIVGTDRLVGVSTHTIEQARAAVLEGADYLGVGPVFSSATKSFDALAGLDFVSQVAAEIGLPWYAIGGIALGNVAAVRDAGAARIAVSAAICASADPLQDAAALRSVLQSGHA
jgi:thiamine-phosphate pyrophosphorylase